MICIYSRKTKKDNFNNNGLGVLNECILAEITEELNGQYFLELEYPANTKKAEYLQEFNIIKANGQLFRIYKVEKNQNDDKRLKVYANHIFYDIAYYFLENLKAINAPVKSAMEKAIIDGLKESYLVDSDIITYRTLDLKEINPAEVIFKIIETWGEGELLRDNYNIKILKKMGEDTGVLIKYGKNIKGFKVTVDTSNVVTKIYPKGANGITLREKYINVPNWDSDIYPPFPIIKKVEFKEAQDEVTLRLIATKAAEVIGLNSVNIQVDFIELTKAKQYERFKHLERVKVGDIVTVRHSEFNIDVKVKVIKVKRDLLSGVNTKIELGQPLEDLLKALDATALIKTATDELGNQVAQAMTSILYYTNSEDLIVTTTGIEPVYLGISAVANTNLSLSLAICCAVSSECTLTIQIFLDNNEIPFRPKQKLLVGDNIIGIPLGIPQVASGPHYLKVKFKIDTGTVEIPMNNLQCMIDGRNLQGGLSANLPYAEATQKIEYVEVYNNEIKQLAEVRIEEIVRESITEHIAFNHTDSWNERVNTEVIVTLE